MEKNKNILFKNVTTYDNKKIEEFNEFYNKKNKSHYAYIAFLIIILVYAVITLSKINSNLAICIFLIILLCILLYSSNKKEEVEKNNDEVSNKTFTFYIYNKFFYVIYNKQKDKVSFMKIHKIYETEKNFYLFINRDYSFVFDKDGFENETSEEFRKFVKRNYFLKYKKSI